MPWLDSVRSFLGVSADVDAIHTRAIDSFVDHPGLTQQIQQAFGGTPRPWRPAGIRDAIGVPAIHGAVTLIANVGGSLSMEAWRDGVKLSDEDRPRIVVRPDPFRIPRDFYRDTVYSMATRGEAWWWVAKRDTQQNALSLLCIPAHEINVTENPRDLRYPDIEWRGKKMPNEDMRQITLMREPGELRGYGPLQVCGAAVSIAVEAQEWAANFFAAGGYPNIWIKAAGDLSGGLEGDPETDDEADWLSEVQRLKAQWIETAPNTPRVTDEGILDIKQFDPNPQGAQMLDARAHQDGDAARMFRIPGPLLEYSMAGGSLVYQNRSELMTVFLETCLAPNYLEAIEQTMSDLLPSATVARFSVEGITRADIKTRYEVYGLGITSGILLPEDAQRSEGIIPGGVETAPVPMAPPAALPASLPTDAFSLPVGTRAVDMDIRCDGWVNKRRAGITRLDRCDKLLSREGVFIGTCSRCKKVYQAAA